MYRTTPKSDLSPQEFKLPFQGNLSGENRWVIMAKLVPWAEFEEKYAQNFSENMGAIAKPFRMALGALIIKEKLGISDRETVEQIKENPYLQYFLGMDNYTNAPLFDASLMVYFRERIGQDVVNKINQQMVIGLTREKEESPKKNRREPRVKQQ